MLHVLAGRLLRIVLFSATSSRTDAGRFLIEPATKRDPLRTCVTDGRVFGGYLRTMFSSVNDPDCRIASSVNKRDIQRYAEA